MKGSMTEVRPGVWRLRAVAGYDSKGRPKQVNRTIRGTKRTAQSELAKLVSDVGAGRTAMPTDLTVGQLLDRWLAHIALSRSPTTIRGYRSKVRRIQRALGSVKLSKLSPRHVDDAYAAWLVEGLTPSTVRHLGVVLASCLHQAVRWGLIPFAPTDRATPPKLHIKPAPEAVDPAVVRLLIEAAEETHPVLAAAILLGALTGARRGELCGLRWSDIDESRAVLRIERAAKLAASGREVVMGPTKTHQVRRVSLDPVLLSALATHRARCEELAAMLGTGVDEDGYVLSPDPTGGTPLRPDSLTQMFSRQCTKLGISGLRLHDLRHFSASMLIAAGLDPRTVATRLGHADPGITLRIYAGALEAKDRQAARILGSLIGPAPTGSATAQSVGSSDPDRPTVLAKGSIWPTASGADSDWPSRRLPPGADLPAG